MRSRKVSLDADGARLEGVHHLGDEGEATRMPAQRRTRIDADAAHPHEVILGRRAVDRDRLVPDLGRQTETFPPGVGKRGDGLGLDGEELTRQSARLEDHLDGARFAAGVTMHDEVPVVADPETEARAMIAMHRAQQECQPEALGRPEPPKATAMPGQGVEMLGRGLSDLPARFAFGNR